MFRDVGYETVVKRGRTESKMPGETTTPLAVVVRPPYRPEPGRGRPPLIVEEPEPPPLKPLPPLRPIEQRAVDYCDRERSMAQLDLVLRETRRSLDVLTHGAPAATQTTATRVEEGEINK
jgi:hypothetical protein